MRRLATTNDIRAGVMLAFFACLAFGMPLTAPTFVTAQTGPKALSANAKPTPTPTPSRDVTSTIFDKTVGDTTFLQLRSDDLNPDLSFTGGGFGRYQSSTATGVVSDFEGYQNSDWDVHLENSATRWINLTLSRLSGSGPTGDYTLHARVIARCFDPTGVTTNTLSWSSITTSNPNCSMHVNFVIGGTQYGLIMSPYYANTGRSVVSCNVVSSGSCVDWTILPNLVQGNVINPNPTVANLYSVDAHNGKMTLVGTYYLTYRMHVTYP